ncbi:MAG: Fic family protein [Acidiferrobacter sp.]
MTTDRPQPFYAGLDEDIKVILLAQVRNLWTHASTAIEGNTLTLDDTAFVLEEGLTIAGKPLREHQEVYGHAKGIEVIYRLLEAHQLQEADIFALHRVVLTEAITDIYKPVGAWKNEANFTTTVGPDGRQHWREFPEPGHILSLMSQWINGFNGAYSQPLDQQAVAGAYADIHLDFVTVHPFFDGNGRMARLLANLPVLRAGFPPIVVPAEDRQEYKKAISDYQQTIPDLKSLSDLRALPRNAERTRFQELCRSYWGSTMTLVAEARQAQERKRVVAPRNPDTPILPG